MICNICLKRLLSRSFRHYSANDKVVFRPRNINLNFEVGSFRSFSVSGFRSRLAVESAASSYDKLPLRYVYVHTALGRWNDVPDGVILDVGYGDSMPDKTQTRATPTVLALHTTPGSHADLAPILRPFVKSGCRVITPNFPGFGITEGITVAYSDVFNHSTDEKAEFIRDFLATLEIDKVDLVIGHGAACYPLLRLVTTIETKDIFKSAAFISPWPHREFRGIQPVWLHHIISFLWDRPFLRFGCRLLSIAAKRRLGLDSQFSYKDSRITSKTINGVGFDEIAGGLIAADVLHFPYVVFYSEQDPFVEGALYDEMVRLLGTDEDHVTEVNKEGKVQRAAAKPGFPKIVKFETGGQDLHQRYSGLINAVSLDLINQVRSGIK